MILVDTSVWIEGLRRGDSPEANWIRAAVRGKQTLCICGVIVTEVLQGVRHARDYAETKAQMEHLVYLLTPRETYVLAADIYRAARARGKTIRNTVDCIIAACALLNDVPLAQRDRDFETIADVSDLRLVDLGDAT